MPFIKRDFIDELANKVDIIATISKRVPLIKKGKNYTACCPFHQEKTPSFSVSAEKQAYYCFGCNESGSSISFVQKFDNLDFIEAVERLAEENNITIEYDTKVKPIDKSFAELKNLIQEVNNFYKTQLIKSPIKQQAVDYAKNRGISGIIAKRFEIGFAPAGWDNLYQQFKDNQLQIKYLIELGLIVENQKKPNQYYDRFRSRLMFPIHNVKNQVIGFGGRVLSNEDSPKYLNSSQSRLFDKSGELYGLYQARKYSKKIDYLLVVEGYMDVVALHEGGITKCVATLGTAVTQQHLQILKRNTKNIIFCFDGDKAGFNAGVKALKLGLPLICAEMNLKFLFLATGEDPDSAIKKEGKKGFKEKIDNAYTLSKFLFSYLKSGLDFTTIEGKTEFLQIASELIKTVKYSIYQEQLIQGLADEVGQSLEIVQKIINSKDINNSKKIPQISPQIVTAKDTQVIDNTTKNFVRKLLSLILNNPSIINNELLAVVRKIPQTKILQDIINNIEFDENVTTEMLLRPYKGQEKVYQRLLSFTKNILVLTEVEAKNELKQTLTSIKEYQKQQERQQQIYNSNSYNNDKQKVISNSFKNKKQ